MLYLIPYTLYLNWLSLSIIQLFSRWTSAKCIALRAIGIIQLSIQRCRKLVSCQLYFDAYCHFDPSTDGEKSPYFMRYLPAPKGWLCHRQAGLDSTLFHLHSLKRASMDAVHSIWQFYIDTTLSTWYIWIWFFISQNGEKFTEFFGLIQELL